ncbi:MAG TPA: LysR substrate-binding domain-containing protein [Microvirga sp.]|nr:LysR substrate-binding domain-containing protein [Microvirga sp.]
MAVLVAAVDQGGFAAAADSLGLTASGVSKTVSRLETRLGVRLLERTTRRIAPTPEGAQYIETARRILADIEEAEAALVEGRGRPQGRLRVNSGVAFAVHQLAPALGTFSIRYPDVQLDLQVTDRIVDLAAEGADLAIRTGAVSDERLVARGFGEIRRVICASPNYLESRGTPRGPADLQGHACINMLSSPHLSLWPFRGDGGVHLVETRGPLNVDNAEAALALGLAGQGLIRLGDFVVANAVRDGRLVAVLKECHHVEPVPISLVFPPGRQRLPRMRVFLDFIMERFHASPWRLD